MAARVDWAGVRLVGFGVGEGDEEGTRRWRMAGSEARWTGGALVVKLLCLM